MKRKLKISPEEQRRRFEEAAREAGVDERRGTLERVLRKVDLRKPKKTKRK